MGGHALNFEYIDEDIMTKNPKLAAANGTKIEVFGEAVLEFEEKGMNCNNGY